MNGRSHIISPGLALLQEHHHIYRHVISCDGRWIFFGVGGIEDPASQTLYVAPNALY